MVLVTFSKLIRSLNGKPILMRLIFNYSSYIEAHIQAPVQCPTHRNVRDKRIKIDSTILTFIVYFQTKFQHVLMLVLCCL